MGGFVQTSFAVSGKEGVDSCAASLQGRPSPWIMGGGATEAIQAAEGRQAEQNDKRNGTTS